MHPILRGAIVALSALAVMPVASAQQSRPAVEAGRQSLLVTRPQSAWPKLLPQSSPGEIAATAPAAESDNAELDSEVEQARARCSQLLEGLDVVAIPHAAIREGECGAPAPMQLVSVGSNPQIAFSPPPVLTCDMIAALHRWLQRDAQPLARKHLGAPLVGITTMSSYSCRRAYGRAKGRLSEHGRVNAIDIAAFLTAEGRTAVVVADWGPIARDIAAKAIAAQAARKRQVGSVAQPAKEEKAPPRTASSGAPTFRSSFGVELPAILTGEPPSGASTGFGWAPPSYVGGPKPTTSGPPGDKGLFLRAAHRAACRIFATVLGPEANKAHKNHFHLDMARRKSVDICE